MINAKNVSFHLNFQNLHGLFNIDINLIRRLIDNLVSNALKFSTQDNKIILKAESISGNPPKFRIQVIDEGVGIPEEYHSKIFNEFEVGSLKRQGVQQTGLGLSFCKMVAEAHGGTIKVSNNNPKGTIFTVEI